MLSLAFGIFNWFSFQLVSLSLWTYSFKDLLFISVGPIFWLILWKLVSPYGSTIYLVKVLWFAFALCTLTLVACPRWFWGSEDSIFVHSSIVHEHWGASSFLFRTHVLDLLDCFSPLWRCLKWFHLFLQSLDPQYSLIPSNYSPMDMCIWFHSYLEKCTLYGGTHIILAF